MILFVRVGLYAQTNGGSIVDMSNWESIAIPEPQRATVRITGIKELPTSRTTEKKAELELDDGAGHRFKKKVLLHLHGGYSTRFPKKSFTCTFCEDDWQGEETTKIQIGDWVPQDGFIFMAFYTDFSRGIGEIGYDLYRALTADRDPVWERAGLNRWDSRARCVPDGFPCELYLGDEFMGIYVWQLRKNHHNYNQQSHLPEHIHLDGNLNDDNIFRGTIQRAQFEVRNPQDLYTQNGAVYKGEQPTTLMGRNSSNYNVAGDSPEVKEAKERSAKVKDYVMAMASYRKELTAREIKGATETEMRSAIEYLYDVESMLDYAVFFRLLMNGDGTLKNWQWFTYDGVKWFVMPYDLDQTFGITLYGYPRPATLSADRVVTGPFYWLDRYFKDDERMRYCDLRSRGVLTAEMVQDFAYEWGKRVGEDLYQMERQRWPESPCYCDPVCGEGWSLCEDWERYSQIPGYDKKKAYEEGDTVKHEGRLWIATKDVIGVTPVVRNSGEYTFEAMAQWVEERVAYLDELYALEDYQTGIESPVDNGGVMAKRGLFDLQGRPLQEVPRRGLYIHDGKIVRAGV